MKPIPTLIFSEGEIRAAAQAAKAFCGLEIAFLQMAMTLTNFPLLDQESICHLKVQDLPSVGVDKYPAP